MPCEEVGLVEKSSGASPQVIAALLSLNFFMADMQAGIGPFLGVFLLAHGWQSGLIGTVMTVGGVAGGFVNAPPGGPVGWTQHQKGFLVLPPHLTRVASWLILLSPRLLLVS